MGRALLLGIAFANLVYLRLWTELFQDRTTELFFRKQFPSPSQYLAVLTNVAALGLVTAALILLAPRMNKIVRVLLLVCGAALIGSALRATLSQDQPLLRAGLFRYLSPTVIFAVAAAALAAAFVVALKHIDRVETVASGLMLALSPCLLVTVPQAIRFSISPKRLAADPPLAPFLNSAPPRRVVWIIFDEWDYRLTFRDRPAGVHMPAVDKLRGESFAADAAVPPSNATDVSMPAFLYGHLIPLKELGSEPNLFSQARQKGWNVAAAGWRLPYCRAFASVLSGCYWDELHDQSNSSATTFAGAFQYQDRSLFETNLFSLFGQSAVARRHAEEFRTILDYAHTFVADGRLTVTLLHFNVPHPPYFYDAKRGDMQAAGRSASGYPDALALVDRTLADVLEHLQASGLAPRTTLIVSSDHWLRSSRQVDGKEDHHVPFMVYIPGGGQGLRYGREFPTIVTHDLIPELLSDRLRTHAEVGDWITAEIQQMATGADGQF